MRCLSGGFIIFCLSSFGKIVRSRSHSDSILCLYRIFILKTLRSKHVSKYIDESIPSGSSGLII